jgi:dipeptidyl aminopeptidase/acylaminoacyl peptidase
MCCLLAFVLLASVAHGERLQFSDRARIVNASEPQLSPDGRQLLCVISRVDVAENRHEPQVAVIDVATGAQHMLTADRRAVTSPRWSPDGQRIAFLANATAEKEAKRQLWILPMSGGDAKRITDADKGVLHFSWSPDGSSIAFATADEITRDDKHNLSFEVGDDDFLTTSPATPQHVWIVATDGASKPRRLTSGTWSLPITKPPGPPASSLAWSPESKSLAIVKVATPHTGNGDTAHIELVDVATGAMRRLTTSGDRETHPTFSPDGATVAYLAARDGQRLNETSVWIAPASGGEGREIARGLDRNIGRAIWMPDGKTLLVGAHDATSTAYWLQPVDGSAAKRIALGDVEPTFSFWIDASVAPNGTIAFTGTTPSRAREIYVMSSTTSAPRQLTTLNAALSSLDLGRTEPIAWKNEGFDENGIVTYPPGFDASKKYPLVLYIHGGPRASSTTGWAFLPQLFAAQGWIVFQPNYRGSDNLGNRYELAIAGDSGAGPGRDVMAGLAALQSRGFVDKDRIVVGGWSYGGYMTSWMIGHYDIFKAAVSGAAVNNLVDAYSLSDSNALRGYSMGGSPFVGDNLKKYLEQSPLTYARNVKAPTLILSDTGDFRVPITQSYEMFHALKDNGVMVKFIAYPVTGHNPEDPVYQSDIDRRYVEWFSRYLK